MNWLLQEQNETPKFISFISISMSTGFVDYLHSASAMNKSDTQGVLCSKDDGLIHPHVPSAF